MILRYFSNLPLSELLVDLHAGILASSQGLSELLAQLLDLFVHTFICVGPVLQ